jgi:hypothetical protein
MIAQSWPIAAPILRSGRPCGQEKFSSNASMPVSWHALDDLDPRVLVVLLHDRRRSRTCRGTCP